MCIRDSPQPAAVGDHATVEVVGAAVHAQRRPRRHVERARARSAVAERERSAVDVDRAGVAELVELRRSQPVAGVGAGVVNLAVAVVPDVAVARFSGRARVGEGGARADVQRACAFGPAGAVDINGAAVAGSPTGSACLLYTARCV